MQRERGRETQVGVMNGKTGAGKKKLQGRWKSRCRRCSAGVKGRQAEEALG